MIKLIYGIGYNDADYNVTQRVNGKTITCPFYRKWCSMLRRCYDEKWLSQYPSYDSCTACEEWLTFSNFKAWMETQDWQGKQLDKDFLTSSKIYSPDNCVFVERELNTFITLSDKSRGTFPLGVGNAQSAGKYRAHISGKNLGTFDTILEAHQAWQREKLNRAINYQESNNDVRVKDGLQRIINLLTEDLNNNRITTNF